MTVTTRRRLMKLQLLLGLFSVSVTIVPLILTPVVNAAVGINHSINFQGKLTNPNGTNIANGNYNFVFSLYSVSSGGSAVWTESDTLTLTDGVFQVNLGPSATGANTNFGNVDFNSDSLYLGIKVGADAEMSPRVQFTATPYAFNSEKLGGISAAGFAQLNPASAQSGSLNVTGSVQAATSLQAPLVDTATAVALNVGTVTASSVTVGRSSAPVTIQGNGSSTFTATSGGFTTTVGFVAPTAARAINFPDAGGTICTTAATTCSATYQTAGNYLQKNVSDSSTVNLATANYTFTQNGSGGVVALVNAGTGPALAVTQSANPTVGAVVVNNTNGVPSGNLIALQNNGTNKFTVDTAGAVGSGTINGQTITSTASFTGTVAAATSFISPLHQTADSTSASTASIIVRSGNATVGAGLTSGAVTVDSGTATGTTGAVNIGISNASTLNIGRPGASFFVQGNSASTIAATSGSFTTTVGFIAPTAARAINFPDAGGTICTTTASTCSSTYLPATNSYIAKNAADTSSASIAGYLLGLTNTNSTATGVLQLTGSGTNSTLAIASSGNPSAGQALIMANNTAASPSGNLIDLQVGGTSKFSVTSAGAVSEAGGLTVSSGGIAATGNSTIAGTLGSLTGLTVVSGGASISGGINNNTGGITNAAALSGVTTISLNSTISGGTTYSASTSVLAPIFDSSTAIGLNIGTGSATGITLGKAGVGTTTFGISNNNAGISGTGAISNATTISLNSTISGGTTYSASTAMQAPLFDIGSAGALSVGTGNASSINIGKSSGQTLFTMQGTSASTITATNTALGVTTTVGFTAPTAARSISFPDAGGTICTTVASTCSGTYMTSGGNYINKNAQDSSSASVTGALLSFSNTSAGAASALSLTNAGTNAALSVTQSSNPSAGQAALLVNNSNASPSGNLIDLQAGSVSKFSVSATGAVTEAAGLTVSSGGIGITAGGLTVTAGLSTLSGGLSVTSAASISGGLNNNNGGITNAAAISGATTIALNSTISGGTTYTASVAMQAPAFDTSTAAGLAIGGTNATGVTVGKSGVGTTTFGVNNSNTGITNTGSIAGATTIALNSTISGGTVYSASSQITAPTLSSADTNAASTNSGTVTFRSGNAAGATSNSGSVTVDAGTATGTAGSLFLGNTNAAALFLGRSGAQLTVQGNSSSTIAATSGANTTTVGFTTPTAARSILFPDAGGTICTTTVSTCSATYLPATNSYIAKNAADTSSASVSGNLLSLTNTSGTAAGVLSLTNSGTNSALAVNGSSNPTAGQAIILINNANATPSGNLILAQANGATKFTVDAAGLINGQTITNAANFTGTVTAASTVSITTGGITVAAGGANITGNINANNSGISNAGAVSGVSSLTINTGGTIDTAAAGTLNIGTTAAGTINVGRTTATLSLQGSASTSLAVTTGANSTTVNFASPSATIVYQFANAAAGTYQICTTYAATCNSTFAVTSPSGAYIQLAPSAAQTDATSNSSVFINKTVAGNLLNLQASGSTVFSVQTNGNLTSTGLASLANGVVTANQTTFQVKIGGGTPVVAAPTAAGSGSLYVTNVAEVAGQLFVGISGNGVTVSSASTNAYEPTLSGTARHQKAIRLQAEYPGAVLDPGGAASITGTLTAGYDSGVGGTSGGSKLNFYKWTTGQNTTQTYDIVVAIPLPDDWAAWNGAGSVVTYGTGTGVAVTATVLDTTGTTDTAVNGAALTVSTTNTARALASLAGTYTAGGTMTLRLRLASGLSGDVRVGTITLPYLSKY